MLPIKTTHNHESKALLDSVYMYDVSPYEIMDGVTEIYMESCIFGALADAKLSEHASRMLAMKNATDNAHKVIKELNVVYHRARQQAITNELIDVINGSNQ
jgi:F-type H+-transporting ATPase subunit gamma